MNIPSVTHGTFHEVKKHLNESYCGALSAEFMHLKVGSMEQPITMVLYDLTSVKYNLYITFNVCTFAQFRMRHWVWSWVWSIEWPVAKHPLLVFEDGSTA